MLIIPALDILDGKLVRLEKGKYESCKVYSDNPFELAEQFSSYGFDLLHIVDLSGSKNGRICSLDLITKIIDKLKIRIQFGGGIRTLLGAELLFNSGVNKIVIGSISVSDKLEFEKIIKYYGTENIICAIDSYNENIRIKGWTQKTGITIYQHINYCIGLGTNTFLCTDIEHDGMLDGPNINLYKKLITQFPSTQIIASGGVSCVDDIKKLKSIGVYGLVTGKAIYENKIELKELAELAR